LIPTEHDLILAYKSVNSEIINFLINGLNRMIDRRDIIGSEGIST